MIWLSLAIPVLAALCCGFLKDIRHRITWWEMTLPILVGVLFISLFSWLGKRSQTGDVEYWGGWVRTAEHYEDWNERVPCRHPKYRTVSDGKGGTRTVFDGYQHIYDVDYHPDEYLITTSNGETVHSTEKAVYAEMDRFGGRKFKDLHRSYHTNDGDLWYAHWPGSDETISPTVIPHSYENRVQAAQDSILSYADLSEEEIATYGVYADYPTLWVGYRGHSALGMGDAADDRLSFWNAKLGTKKKVRMWLLGFDSTKYQRESGIMQERAWKGGNKNEVVLCVGVDDTGKPAWSHVFGWTDSEECKIEIRNAAMELGADPIKLVDRMAQIVDEKYELVDWSKFDYLDIKMPVWAIVVTYLLVALSSAGLSWWAYHNEHHEGDPLPWNRNQRRGRSPYPMYKPEPGPVRIRALPPDRNAVRPKKPTEHIVRFRLPKNRDG